MISPVTIVVRAWFYAQQDTAAYTSAIEKAGYEVSAQFQLKDGRINLDFEIYNSEEFDQAEIESAVYDMKSRLNLPDGKMPSQSWIVVRMHANAWHALNVDRNLIDTLNTMNTQLSVENRS